MLPKIPSKIIENANGGKGHNILPPVPIPDAFKKKNRLYVKGTFEKSWSHGCAPAQGRWRNLLHPFRPWSLH